MAGDSGRSEGGLKPCTYRQTDILWGLSGVETTDQFLSFVENILHDILEAAVRLEVPIQPVQQQRVPRVLDRVMGVGLDVLFQKEPREKAEGQLALSARDGVDVNRVHDLVGRDEDVDRPEILREPVADKDAAEVDEEAKLFVSNFEGDEGVRGVVWVQIAVWSR